MTPRHRVIIIGGGFGGLRAARALRSALVDVTVIDRRNYHSFNHCCTRSRPAHCRPGRSPRPYAAC
jgi:NADH:ubiquinone reductase (H+-translocating)